MTVDQDEYQKRKEEANARKRRENRRIAKENRQKSEEARKKAKAEAKAIKAQDLAEAELKRAERTAERRSNLTPNPEPADLLKRANQQEYYIRTVDGLPLAMIDLPRRALNLVSKARYHERQAREFYQSGLVEHYKGNEEESEVLFKKHDESMKEFLYSCYGVGVLYNKCIAETGNPV